MSKFKTKLLGNLAVAGMLVGGIGFGALAAMLTSKPELPPDARPDPAIFQVAASNTPGSLLYQFCEANIVSLKHLEDGIDIGARHHCVIHAPLTQAENVAKNGPFFRGKLVVAIAVFVCLLNDAEVFRNAICWLWIHSERLHCVLRLDGGRK